jgi:hypothetical protein
MTHKCRATEALVKHDSFAATHNCRPPRKLKQTLIRLEADGVWLEFIQAIENARYLQSLAFSTKPASAPSLRQLRLATV